MRQNESATSRTISRVAVRRLDERQGFDPLLYSAEIATAGVFCALAMLLIIAVL